MKLGLDELIIVNPGAPPAATSWFLGDDGGVYRRSAPTSNSGVWTAACPDGSIAMP